MRASRVQASRKSVRTKAGTHEQHGRRHPAPARDARSGESGFRPHALLYSKPFAKMFGPAAPRVNTSSVALCPGSASARLAPLAGWPLATVA